MTLDEVEEQMPWGLHDASLVRLEVDWSRRQLTLEARVQIGERQETDQLARITISGLYYFTATPPASEAEPSKLRSDLPWIDARPGAATDEAKALLPPTPDGHFLHHILIQESWEQLHICGRDAQLTWLEPSPRPKDDGRRTLFPGDEVPDPKGSP